jgi:protein KTI12
MALITISGYPCSGKSRRAEQIKVHLQTLLQASTYDGPNLNVTILSDDILNIDRAAYNGVFSAPQNGMTFNRS